MGRLASFGHGSFKVLFFFKWQSDIGSVRFCAKSRQDVARLLLLFRRARRWWLSYHAPLRSTGRATIPRFGLRWIAAYPCRVVVVDDLDRHWGVTLPSARVIRPCKRSCLLTF